MTSRKQSILLAELAKTGELTLDRAVKLVGDQYHNQRNHTGNILRNMVKRGLLERVRPGVFRRPKPTLFSDESFHLQ